MKNRDRLAATLTAAAALAYFLARDAASGVPEGNNTHQDVRPREDALKARESGAEVAG